ncbi:MAG: hypothetical protein JNK74_00895 [Candidatus Hydrogenedentes bacterium]|nr:hypothetical protein [Candidatus Hydrogenedentota bacterium]
MARALSLVLLLSVITPSEANSAASPPGETLYLPFEETSEILSDFVSRNEHYKSQGAESLKERALSIGEGRFGNGLHIEDGAPKSAGTWNQSGLDCDLTVAVVWGEWRKKPHYWGSGHFYGDRGTVAFWVKGEAAHRGVLFMQGSSAWGRKERDLFTVEVDQEGRLHAHLRDVRSEYHRVKADQPTWQDGAWHHVAMSYDRAYGMKLYHNGKLVGSSWGQDAWWQAPLPGLFSPFLQQSRYDEIRMFDYPLDDAEIAALYEKNEAPANPALRDAPMDGDAARRLLAEYGDLDAMELPVVKAGEGVLPMRQSLVESCLDEQIPVSFIMDGRYELAWPAPYRLFTFILGDADFHGENIEVKLATGEKPNYVSFEGTLSGLDVRRNKEDVPLLRMEKYAPVFYSEKIDLKGDEIFQIPLVKEHGLPEDLEGSAEMPLTEPTRIHEMQLWEVGRQDKKETNQSSQVAYIGTPIASTADISRYWDALEKLKGGQHRVVLPTSAQAGVPSELTLAPLQSIHVLAAPSKTLTGVDAIGLRLVVNPQAQADVLWMKLRDPGNPSRFWTQSCVRIDYSGNDTPQVVELMFDITDLVLADNDRLLVELTFAKGATLVVGGAAGASALTLTPTSGQGESLAQYAQHALLPARMQYMKEYNYRPWLFAGDTISVDEWEVFGGPYDMAYPPLAVLRIDPENEMAKRYKTLLFDRAWFGSIDEDEPERPLRFEPVEGAPAWATAQRELLAANYEVVDWIVGQQRKDGMFWGGSNDDSFIPLGWAALPLLGHEGARKSWLRFYDGLEALGIYKDGYCDIWPIDPLHITDYICSRPLMLSNALGNPRVFERELQTARRYRERVEAANAARAQKGLAPLNGDRAMRDQPDVNLIDQMDSEIGHYTRTHLGWWWGETETRPPHAITDRADIARQMMDAVKKVDDLAVFGLTEARVHTDNQRGIGREVLTSAALGGRLQAYTEPFPPSIAVSWEDVDSPDFSRLVSYADDTRLVVNCYNFDEEPVECAMRVWRLESGTYEVAVGADLDDDGAIDADAVREVATVQLSRFSTVPFNVPAGQNTIISINRIGAVEHPAQLADLAISHEDIQIDGNTVTVTVHNLGGVAAYNVQVALIDRKGIVLAEERIAHIDTPRSDLAARRTTVTITTKGESVVESVFVDPGDIVAEVFEENNEVTLARQ